MQYYSFFKEGRIRFVPVSLEIPGNGAVDVLVDFRCTDDIAFLPGWLQCSSHLVEKDSLDYL